MYFAIYIFFYLFILLLLFQDGEPVNEADQHGWYLEVVERLKKADQYRVRSHGGTSETPEGQTGRAVLSPVSLVASSPR